MGKIVELSQHVSNQIAAGEVVERPASVIKELIENSIDAGANNIEVRIGDGGLTYMVVQDDGVGMEEDDVALAIRRYATSKLSSTSDLDDIKSFGFRGEALPSIASIANLSIISRQESSDFATKAKVAGGNIVEVSKAGALVGTRIEVRDLFFNVPARLKFVKTKRSETANIDRLLRAFAFIFPQVGFKFFCDNKLIFSLANSSDDNPIERAQTLLGKDSAGMLHPFEASTELLKISGVLCAPMVTRRDTQGINIFVNNRLVSDKKLVGAVKAAFRSLLEVGRNPIIAIKIDIGANEVDVNVHPQKTQVRFVDERRVMSHMISMLSEILSKTPWLRSSDEAGDELPHVLPAQSLRKEREQALQSVGLLLSDDKIVRPKVRSSASYDYKVGADAGAKVGAKVGVKNSPGALTNFFGDDAGAGANADANANGVANFFDDDVGAGANVSANANADTSAKKLLPTAKYSQLKILGQVNATYLLLASEHGLVVVDQHAAHERVRFEEIRRQKNPGQSSSPLLIPISMELDSGEMQLFIEHRKDLLALGIDAEVFGEETIVIRALPDLINKQDAIALTRDILSQIAQDGRSESADEIYHHVCATLACHSSIRAGQKLSHQEIEALLEQLDVIDFGAHCPHGRPVVKSFSDVEMKKWFDRT